jgi:hypothetical protein
MDEYSDPTPIPTVDQFKAALLTVRDRIGMSPKDVALLKAHCRASNHTISTVELAKLLGYANYSAVNLHYGKLARDVADALNYAPKPNASGDAHWWRTLAYGNDGKPRTKDGHYEWIMRPELVQVLQEWKWA